VDLIQLLREFGGLGIAAYLIVWMTRKFNGKIDALVKATDSNTAATREAAAALRQMRDAIERGMR
jgi:N-acetylglucosamine kinase-like BadF-type ATPase